MTDKERAGVKDKAEPLLAELAKANAELVALLNANITPQGLDAGRQAVIDRNLGERKKFLKTLHDALSSGKKGKLYLNEVSGRQCHANQRRQVGVLGCPGKWRVSDVGV